MSISRVTLRHCDEPGCTVYDRADYRLIHHTLSGDFCTTHFPCRTCSGCDRRMRPYQTRIADWPGTVSPASSTPPLCSGCRQKLRMAPRPRKTWTCHCGAKTFAGDATWWRNSYFGALCPKHRHPLCRSCFSPMRNTTEPPDGTTRRYNTAGRCTSCTDGRVMREVDIIPQRVLRLIPQDLQWMFGAKEETL